MSGDGSVNVSLGSAFAGPGGSEEAVWPSVAVARDLGRARQEWLHTNGAGAYASSTLACMHTRRYHGLLVAALEAPRGRHVFLSHVDATLAQPRSSGGGQPPSVRSSASRWELAKHQFPGVDPKVGPFYLERFEQDPLPRWTYEIPLGRLTVTLALVRGVNAAVLRYVWQGAEPILLRLRPLLAARSFHDLQREHGGMLQRVEIRSLYDGSAPLPSVKVGEMRVQPRRELPRICFRYEGTFVGSPDWWRRFEYLIERDRGADYEEDLWTPGVFEVLLGRTPSYLVAAVEKLPQGEPEALLSAAEASLRAEDPGPSAKPVERRLTIAAEAFRADLARRPGIIAGYPWFEVWGRDTLLALPGLYLVPKRYDGAMRILRQVIACMQDGLIPNRIGDDEAPSAPAPDTTLWLFEVARLLADALGDRHPFVTDELLLALRDAFDAALGGTRYGIHITEEGLFAVGNAGEALSWMDARVRARPMPEYAGCPVELSALWARGCDTLARLARAAGDAGLAGRAQAECRRTRAAFQASFWCEETSYPYDVLSELDAGESAFRDASVRPYAVIALAVDPECFTEEQRSHIIDRARQELLTQAGLRTLAPSDPSYVARYGGGVETDDRTYHQGAVYPWLLGFFIRAARQSGAEGEHLIPLLSRLVDSATANALALGQVPEIADGEPPHTPAGCTAQAFSVAELLRAAAWDLR
jgi:predicted glycogen debranching enzyme